MGDFKFVERADHERGFSEVYDRDIAPYLREKEKERSAAMQRSKWWIWLVTVIAATLAWIASRLDPILSIFPITFGGGTILFIHLSRNEKIRTEITGYLRPIICDFYENINYIEKPSEDLFNKKNLEELNVIPVSNKYHIGPIISGTWRGFNYSLINSSFKNEYRNNDGKLESTPLFTGIILEIACRVDMPTVVFYPNLGDLLNKVHNWSVRNSRPPFKFEVGHSGATEHFQIYTDDLKRTKELLDEKFLEKLIYFSQEYQPSKQYIAATFQNRKFYLAISIPHEFMDFNVASRPLHECNDKIHQAMKDLMIPRQIIDILID